MAGETLTTLLPGIVQDIRARSFTYIAQEGVMKSLVTRFSGTGNAYTEPYFDPTAIGSALSTIAENADITTATSISTTRRTYTPVEYYMYTFMTDKSVKMSVEQTKQFHSESHGYGHAHNLEALLLGTFASFTPAITATTTSGLTWAKIAAARTNLENIPKAAPKPYALVLSPDAFYYFAANMVGTSNYYVNSGTLSNTLQDKYSVGSLVGGVNVYQSSHFTQATEQVAGMFSKAGIALFVPSDLDYRLEEERDASKRGYELISTMNFKARVRVPSYGVKMTLYAKEPS